MSRDRPRRRPGTSSTAVRNAAGGVCLVVVLLLLGQAAFDLAREGKWLGVASVGGVVALLLLIVFVSLRWGHIRFGQGGSKTRSNRKRR